MKIITRSMIAAIALAPLGVTAASAEEYYLSAQLKGAAEVPGHRAGESPFVVRRDADPHGLVLLRWASRARIASRRGLTILSICSL